MEIITAAAREDDLDAILIAELETLRDGERRLQRLFPKLRNQPQLRERFLMELAAIEQRAERLDAVLNPLEFSMPLPLSPIQRSVLLERGS